MPTFEDLVSKSYASPDEWFLDFQSWFQALPLANQILGVILAILAVLATLVIVYYVLKGVGYLIYYTFKVTYYILKFFLWDIPAAILGLDNKEIDMQKGLPEAKASQISVNKSERPRKARTVYYYNRHAHHKRPIYGTAHGRAWNYNHGQAIPITARIGLQQKLEQSKKLFCPMCGQEFTEQMRELMKIHDKVYCEYCGHGLELVIR